LTAFVAFLLGEDGAALGFNFVPVMSYGKRNPLTGKVLDFSRISWFWAAFGWKPPLGARGGAGPMAYLGLVPSEQSSDE
jgi:hypothetical protein